MNTPKIRALLQRIKDLGFSGLVTWGSTKYLRYAIKARYKKKALGKRANHQWLTIAKRLNRDESFAQFFALLKTNRVFEKMLNSNTFCIHIPTSYLKDPNLFGQADAYVNNTFSVLGSPNVKFNEKINWHVDIKLPKEKWGTEYWNQPPLRFYQEIKAQQISDPTSTYNPDIKVPWELSRMQHLFILGLAYKRAMEIEDLVLASRYSSTFVTHIDQWITYNPFLLGVNWVCPMEVAIRAINLIVALQFFKECTSIPVAFWEKLVCSLYDHIYYLEYNPETSDRPNNHYIADLVGQFYLNTFFKIVHEYGEKQTSTLAEIWRQMNKQINPDGSSYEGSTNYHKLVTEMFEHVILLCSIQEIPVPQKNMHLLHMMKTFLQDCTDIGGNLTQIGDNDSGKCITGYTIAPSRSPKLLQYRWAGISIINTHGWHCTFRHPTFFSYQPSGHFHHDELSLTLSLDGRPLLVDSGTFLYTSNTTQRNAFKSAHAHTTYYIPELEPTNPKDLFQTIRTHTNHDAMIEINNETIIIQDYHKKYESYGIKAHRRLLFDTYKEVFEIQDWLEPSTQKPKMQTTHEHHTLIWNMHWAPDIELIQNDDHAWIITKKTKPIAHLTTTLSFVCQETHISPAYGELEATKTLSAQQPVLPTKVFCTKIRRF